MAAALFGIKEIHRLGSQQALESLIPSSALNSCFPVRSYLPSVPDKAFGPFAFFCKNTAFLSAQSNRLETDLPGLFSGRPDALPVLKGQFPGFDGAIQYISCKLTLNSSPLPQKLLRGRGCFSVGALQGLKHRRHPAAVKACGSQPFCRSSAAVQKQKSCGPRRATAIKKKYSGKQSPAHKARRAAELPKPIPAPLWRYPPPALRLWRNNRPRYALRSRA